MHNVMHSIRYCVFVSQVYHIPSSLHKPIQFTAFDHTLANLLPEQLLSNN